MLFDELAKGAVSDIIVQRITDAIINGELCPGDKIPTEMEFCKQLGVGRNSVREAIKVLLAFGVLEIRRGEGTFVVREFTQNLLNSTIYGLILERRSLGDLLEFKSAFLTSILYLAMKKAGKADVVRLNSLVDKLSKEMRKPTPDIDEVYVCSERFFAFLGEIIQNSMLEQLNDIVIKISKYSRKKALLSAIQTDRVDLSMQAYHQMAELIASGDAGALLPVIDNVLDVWRQLLDNPGAPSENALD
jgi:GntR family transcriptional repressor for pyruvate dehydrogenase complex